MARCERARLDARSAIACLSALSACGGELHVEQPERWRQYVMEYGSEALPPKERLRLRAAVCAKDDLSVDRSHLDETSLVTFLAQRGIAAEVEKPRQDLAYVVIRQGVVQPVRLRVAILEDADRAGRELAIALGQSSPGAWGVHRGNVAVLGPVGDTTHDLAFAAQAGLACWGVLTLRDADESLSVPGGYFEL